MPSTSKTSNAIRRASSGLAKVSTPPTSSRVGKGPKQSKMICLKLPSKLLARFAPEIPDQAPSPLPPSKHTPDAAASSPVEEKEPKPVEVKPETISPLAATPGSETPQPASKEPLGKSTTKASSPKTGSKRSLGIGVDGPKPRARPGPKKKIKLDDGNGENGGSTAKGGPGTTSAPAHKLGPKANQGAINAGLRALDRTGKPCRKWEKRGIRIKTFTGITLELPSWRGAAKNIDSTNSPDKSSLPTSNSHSKDNNSSSQVGSESSSATPNAGVKAELPAGNRLVLVP
ncbi:MAG: hypothetical protein Q9181_007579 [Wetmoreana brouardii]